MTGSVNVHEQSPDQAKTIKTKVPARLDRLLTGLGIGGEYAAINSAIDELIPSKHRGVIDVMINGTYWGGAALGAVITVPVTSDLRVGVGWRLCFGLGVVLGLVVLLVRRNVPESPRWLIIHGHADATAGSR